MSTTSGARCAARRQSQDGSADKRMNWRTRSQPVIVVDLEVDATPEANKRPRITPLMNLFAERGEGSSLQGHVGGRGVNLNLLLGVSSRVHACRCQSRMSTSAADMPMPSCSGLPPSGPRAEWFSRCKWHRYLIHDYPSL